MCDNREVVTPDLYAAGYHELAAVVNYLYARRHGYAFRYYTLGEAPRCTAGPRSSRLVYRLTANATFNRLISLHQRWLHARTRWRLRTHDSGAGSARAGRVATKLQCVCRHGIYGDRAAPWGKLLAIHDAIRTCGGRVAYLDTDAIVASPELTLDGFLARHGVAVGTELVVTFNHPWDADLPNSGFMVWQGTDASLRMLQQWWNLDCGPCHTHHDFEQSGLWRLLSTDSSFRSCTAVLPDVSFLEQPGQFVRHVPSAFRAWRRARFRMELRRLGADAEAYARVVCEDIPARRQVLDPLGCARTIETGAQGARTRQRP